jgi:hypothetical protein
MTNKKMQTLAIAITARAIKNVCMALSLQKTSDS